MKHEQFFRTSIYIACLLLAGFTSSNAAEIAWVGADLNVDAKQTSIVTNAVGWRNSATPKAFDIDGDNIYGTDGYRLRGGTSLPAYVSSVNVAGGGNNFGYMDNPSHPAGADDFAVGFWGTTINYGSTYSADFTITGASLEKKVLRIGVQFDTYGTGTATYTLTQKVGGSATATSAVLTFANDGYDWAFFDITSPKAGDKFELTMSDVGEANTINYHAIGGLIFDSKDIQPSGPVVSIR